MDLCETEQVKNVSPDFMHGTIIYITVFLSVLGVTAATTKLFICLNHLYLLDLASNNGSHPENSLNDEQTMKLLRTFGWFSIERLTVEQIMSHGTRTDGCLNYR